ncbi:CoA pyrophosphatase [Pseudonocardiaceae bacterium YIM PH 21723]|nr:CoA pyrophosphatase [Pseudonocardiaceae bacterium YIM PH 21723]
MTIAPGPLVDPADVPDWLSKLISITGDLNPEDFTRIGRPDGIKTRDAAVLILFGEQEHGPDVLLQRRADTLNSHAGQVSFPGGAVDPTDDGPVQAALREAQEETGLLPAGVLPVAVLPELFIWPSQFMVTPVIGHWVEPVAVSPVDHLETAAVARVPLAWLVDPVNRLHVRHVSGYVGPAFSVPGMLVWGFTGGLLSALLSLAGWERPWADESRTVDLEEAWQHALRLTPSDMNSDWTW